MDNQYTNYCNTRLEGEFISILTVCSVLSSIIAVIGNFYIIIAIYRSRNLRTATNFFLGSIAISDIFCGTTVGPLWVVQLSDVDLPDKSDVMRVTLQFLTLQLMLVNTYTVCALSYDRYLAFINFAYYGNIMSKKRSLVIILSVWILSTLLASSRFIFMWIKGSSWFIIGEAILITLVPFLSCYFFTKRFVSKAKALHALPPVDIRNILSTHERAAEEMKKVYLVGIIVLLFLISWTPFFILCGADAIFDSIKPCAAVETRAHLKALTLLLVLGKSAVNPFIYILKINKLRSALRIFCSARNVSRPKIEKEAHVLNTHRLNTVKEKNVISKN